MRRLRAQQAAGEHDGVLRDLEPLIRERPENRDLLLIAAISLRHLGRIAEALATLDRLAALQPRFSRQHQERGLCHVALRDAPGAITSLLQAVNINPALPASWSMLEGLYRLTGDLENATLAAAHVATLKRLPSEVILATSMVSDGDLAAAEPLVRDFLLRHGDHPEAMRLLARIGMARDVLDDAEVLLEGVLALAPDHQGARQDYAQVLVKRHKYALARVQLNRLLEMDPRNLELRSLAATTAVGLGENEAALALYDDMLLDAPNDPDIHLWRGHALKTVGRLADAVEAYRAAAAARPDFGDAYWSLANLKLYEFTDTEIDAMRRAESSPLTRPGDRQHLCFALGKAFEDRDETTTAWTYYERGNGLKRAESRYRPEIIEANTQAQIEVCTRSFFRDRIGWGAPDRDPIFIVGLPRSGSTLIEQILASHSLVDGTQELSDVQALVLELQGRDLDPDNPRYPAVLTSLRREDFVHLGEKYLSDTQVHRAGRPFFIDKMPNNFRHLGLIHLMLPNAKIIDARRAPMACCFSNLKQLFAQGQEFTYSAEDIARYYRTYLDLMEHWQGVLPGRILRVHHEDVVEDLEATVRRILTFCDLPFESACLEFHKTQRSVRTPSSEQVRRPIFSEGLDQWKRFEPWLEPLRTALGDAVTRYRHAPDLTHLDQASKSG